MGEAKSKKVSKQQIQDPRLPGMSRRDFLRSSLFAGTAAATAGLVGCAAGAENASSASAAASSEEAAASSAAASAQAAQTAEAAGIEDPEIIKYLEDVYNSANYGHSPMLAPVTLQNHLVEPPLPENRSLSELGLESEYDVDVLVVGGGLAGMYAARRVKDLGKTALLVDKAIVGKSGLTPWAHTFAWFDEDLGDDKQVCIDSAIHDSQYSARIEYFEQFLDRSKEIYEDATEWGWLRKHDWSTTEDDGLDAPGKMQAHADTDRHLIFRQGLVDEGVDFIERVMITELIKEDDRIQGAVGFHAECEEPIVFKAKAVILATGPGAVRPSGFPTGSSTWDGDMLGYRAGAAVAGKEYTDFHWTLADCPGDIYSMWWRSFEESQLYFPAHFPSDNNMITDVFQVDREGGFITPDREATAAILEKDKAAVDAQAAAAAEAGTTEAGADPREALGNTITPDYLWANREVKETSIGMGLPNQEGLWPTDDKCGVGVDGLYAAGCALGSLMFGAHYVCMGGSSNSCAVQGRVSAEAACEYVDRAGVADPSQDAIQAAIDYTLAPLKREKGFSPEWVEELLCNIMAPYWVAYMKSDETLNTALSSLVSLRDKVVNNLRARSPHELRYCHEMFSKYLNCEMRIRSSLFRTESRGMHYRYDYPFRDDENWMAWVTVRQGDGGEMLLEKVPMSDYPVEWMGDLSQPYGERYPLRIPGESAFMATRGVEIDDNVPVPGVVEEPPAEEAPAEEAPAEEAAASSAA